MVSLNVTRSAAVKRMVGTSRTPRKHVESLSGISSLTIHQAKTGNHLGTCRPSLVSLSKLCGSYVSSAGPPPPQPSLSERHVEPLLAFQPRHQFWPPGRGRSAGPRVYRK